jgi:hypothetical protein
VPGLAVDAEVEQLCRWMAAKHADTRPWSAAAVIQVIDRIADRLAAKRGSDRMRHAR